MATKSFMWWLAKKVHNAPVDHGDGKAKDCKACQELEKVYERASQ